MAIKHLSTQYDRELLALTDQVMAMGTMVGLQIRTAMSALEQHDPAALDLVNQHEKAVNRMEIALDADICRIIARRQPAAGDLRFLLAISKLITDLERIGDEAHKVGKMLAAIHESELSTALPLWKVKAAGELAAKAVDDALAAFKDQDIDKAVEILRSDQLLDRAFVSFIRELITHMMENPRLITACLDLLWLAKAIERMGDHAQNIAESVIYIVKGEDVRHVSLNEIEHLLDKNTGSKNH
jgi:phosphate transport system protein